MSARTSSSARTTAARPRASWKVEISENGQVIEKFSERINGRYPVRDILKPGTGEVLISKDHMMTEDDADA